MHLQAVGSWFALAVERSSELAQSAATVRDNVSLSEVGITLLDMAADPGETHNLAAELMADVLTATQVAIQRRTAVTDNVLPIRGYLLHITHYDPCWCRTKATEEPFEPPVALKVIDAMSEAGLNLLLLDCKDGVAYASHPELARPYTQPMEVVHSIRERCRQHGIELAIKLNFSQSAVHQHNHWFRPHNNLFDNDEYWQRAFQIIDELVAAAQPPRFFHIGMDEDHWRSYEQYVAAIQVLHAGLAERGLRTVIWNDSACGWPQADIHKAKSLYAETRIPTNVVHILWDYGKPQKEALQRIRKQGFELWGAPAPQPQHVSTMCNALRACNGTGIMLTRWQPCVAANQNAMLDQIQTCAEACKPLP